MKNRLFLLFVTVAAALALSGCGYNRFQSLDEQTKSAWSEVLNQYQRRADLVPNIVATVKGEAAFEQDTLTRVIEARSKATSIQATPELINDPEAFNKFQQAQGELSGALSRLMVVSERYPELKADATMQSLSEELASTENRVGFSRQAFNDQVLEFNNAAQQFPTLIVARLANFTPAAMLESTRSEEERAAPQVKF